MNIDLIANEQWEKLNDKVASFLKLSHEEHVRVYSGLSHAVFELAQGALQFYSHKRSIGQVKGQTWAYDFMIANLLREAIQVQSVDHTTLNVAQWVEQLKKDTNFVFFAEDHPVTGEIYPIDELDQLLNTKKIFSFAISHHVHLYKPKSVLPFSTRICSLDQNSTMVFCGERVRSAPLMAHKMAWSHDDFMKRLQLVKKKQESQFLVEEFESHFPDNKFLTTKNRLYDRAVLCFEDVSAEAVAVEIFKKLNITLEKGWSLLGTTNQCFWDSLNMYKGWWLPAIKPEQSRGLLILSCEILETKDFANLVKKAYEEIKAQQSWSL